MVHRLVDAAYAPPRRTVTHPEGRASARRGWARQSTDIEKA